MMKINIGDNVITNLEIKKSPFNNIKGIVVEIVNNDYLLDLSPNGDEFVSYYKTSGNVYGCDWNENIPKTCKWFDREQLIKV